MGPRTCIFTGLRSKHKLEITEDKHSWVRAVPCSKAYLICREDRRYRAELLEIEQDVIHAFFDNELRRALDGRDAPFEETQPGSFFHKKIKGMLQHEIARLEALDDRSFERALDKMMESRLGGLFRAD
jgi:hypothetical protein